MRFGRENRLRLAREIEFLKQNSTKADCSAFVVYVYPRPDSALSRLAIVASKRIGNAVVRNSARRIFREIFRKEAPLLAENADIIVFVRRGWSSFDFQSLSAKFARGVANCIERATNRRREGRN